MLSLRQDYRFNCLQLQLINYLQIQLSGMITEPPQNSKTITPNHHQILDKQAHLRKCQEITNNISGRIQEQIINGQVIVRKKPLHIQPNDNFDRITQNPQKNIRDKINSLSLDLQMLQKQIAIQKEKQKEKQEQKKREASILIERLKKQKQEYRNKIKFNQMSSRLKSSVLSQDVLKQMRERRDSLVLEKKKDMQLRVYKILNRRIERQDDQNRNQISYWTKIKQLEEKKRHQSTKILPSIHKVNQELQFGVNISQKKNSNFSHKRSFSKQDLRVQYQDVVNKFLQRAKAKQTQSKSQQSPHYKSRIINNEAISEKSQSQLVNSKISVKNQKMEKIVASFLQDKRKLLGNSYLKQSLLKVDRAKSPRASTIMDNSFAEESLQLKGNPVIFHKNDKISYLQDRRQKILQSLANSRIQKSLAIEMLGPVQSRLDKIDPEGVEKRLKKKLQLFEQVHRKNQQVERYKPIMQFQHNGI